MKAWKQWLTMAVSVILTILIIVVVAKVLDEASKSDADRQFKTQQECRSLATGTRIALLVDLVSPNVDKKLVAYAKLNKLPPLVGVLKACNRKGE